ncbi:acyltransferase family protein [Leptospira paudalimensis]|uniref:Acyltransferase n=1 Tax=Leptospira paudalimensis TaxID=2950024 RepID=A0ABT3MCR5_9LEPT|nr:acyltransferase [Leptospira paudalimensis]MCW7506014.1 acyltransferase [Leptospira paudalimensis]
MKMFEKDNYDMEWELLGIILAGMLALTFYTFRIPLLFPVPNQSKNNRESRFDVLRGFAMIGIVMIHIHSYFQFFHPGDSFIIHNTLMLSNLARFSVPMFILTSAIFLKIKESYWVSKFKHLILPYTIFSILGYWIKYNHYSLNEFLTFYALGKVFTPFYFVPLLLQFYLLFYILNPIMKGENWRNIILIVSFLINMISNLGFFDTYLPSEYHSISIFNYIFFFVLGIFIGKTKQSKSEINHNSKFIISVYFVLSLILILIFSHLFGTDLKNHHTIYPVLFLLCIWQYLNDFNGSISKVLSFIGNQSLFIFLLHPFIIHFMHSIDPYSFGGPFFGYILTLLLNVGVPILISLIIQKGKFLYQSHHLTE